MSLEAPRAARKAWGRTGWWAGAQRRSSPNFGPRPLGLKPDLMVVHSISLPPGEFGAGFIDEFFLNQLDCSAHPYFEQLRGVQVSAHFVVWRDGAVSQYVSCDQRAWHAGQSSFQGRENCNDFSIGVELEGLEGGDFEVAQYEALADLWQVCAKRYRLNHVAGHEHIAPGRKADPGAGFDWLRFSRLAALPHAALPAEVRR
jgi:N-acetyl-anhydromuramoyl-L-alanine amidase